MYYTDCIRCTSARLHVCTSARGWLRLTDGGTKASHPLDVATLAGMARCHGQHHGASRPQGLCPRIELAEDCTALVFPVCTQRVWVGTVARRTWSSEEAFVKDEWWERLMLRRGCLEACSLSRLSCRRLVHEQTKNCEVWRGAATKRRGCQAVWDWTTWCASTVRGKAGAAI